MRKEDIADLLKRRCDEAVRMYVHHVLRKRYQVGSVEGQAFIAGWQFTFYALFGLQEGEQKQPVWSRGAGAARSGLGRQGWLLSPARTPAHQHGPAKRCPSRCLPCTEPASIRRPAPTDVEAVALPRWAGLRRGRGVGQRRGFDAAPLWFWPAAESVC